MSPWSQESASAYTAWALALCTYRSPGGVSCISFLSLSSMITGVAVGDGRETAMSEDYLDFGEAPTGDMECCPRNKDNPAQEKQ